MHRVIRAIVPADSPEEALQEARRAFQNLVGGGYVDYFLTFAPDERETPVAGKARWGTMAAASRADSAQGRKLIEDGLQFTKSEEKSHAEFIRENPSYRHIPPHYYLYDHSGLPLKDRGDVKSALAMIGGDYRKEAWVVPADVHT